MTDLIVRPAPDGGGAIADDVEAAIAATEAAIAQFWAAWHRANSATGAAPNQVRAFGQVGDLNERLLASLNEGARIRAQIADDIRTDEGLSLAELGARLRISKARADQLVNAALATRGVVKQPRIPGTTARIVPPPGMTTALYRPFDADDRLLYVGVTDEVGQRESSHRRRSSWVAFAVRTDVEWFPSRVEAERAEVRAITSERPLFNDRHNDTPEARQRLVEYLIEKGRLDLLAPAVTRG